MVGWRVFTLTLIGSMLASPTLAQGRACAEPHYRWTEKTDTSLANLTPTPTSLTAILTGWEPPALTVRDRCAKRVGRELAVYSVTGWVRRIEKHKEDGDWHIELTDRRDSPPESCIVVEVPPANLSSRYAQARADLDAFLGGRTIAKDGDLADPLQVRIIGAAFFDGQHRRRAHQREQIDGHGRCNSSVRALWEIHPVYRVKKLDRRPLR